jgi:hypothetical protein
MFFKTLFQSQFLFDFDEIKTNKCRIKCRFTLVISAYRSFTPRALKLPIYEVFIILKDVTMTLQKWGSKQALEKRKTSLSLMEVFGGDRNTFKVMTST